MGGQSKDSNWQKKPATRGIKNFTREEHLQYKREDNQIFRFGTIATVAKQEPQGLKEFWNKRLILVRILKKKTNLRLCKIYRPATVNDLSMRDWWELIHWFIDNREETYKILMLRTGNFHAFLRDVAPEDIVEPEAWIVPKFRKRIKTFPKGFHVHEIMQQCTCKWEPRFERNAACPLHNAIPVPAKQSKKIHKVSH